MPKSLQTTIRLDENQHGMLQYLASDLNISTASVMRKALIFFFESRMLDEESGTELYRGEPDFVLQLKGWICTWLAKGGVSYDMGSGRRNATSQLGEIPMKFLSGRGERNG